MLLVVLFQLILTKKFYKVDMSLFIYFTLPILEMKKWRCRKAKQLAWLLPSQRVGHDGSDLAAAAASRQ